MGAQISPTTGRGYFLFGELGPAVLSRFHACLFCLRSSDLHSRRLIVVSPFLPLKDAASVRTVGWLFAITAIGGGFVYKRIVRRLGSLCPGAERTGHNLAATCLVY